MSVRFTKDAEKLRVEEEKERRTSSTWELYKSTALVETLRRARDMGWAENKVQVRVEREGDTSTYYIEPYEKGCGCRGILRYKDFFMVNR